MTRLPFLASLAALGACASVSSRYDGPARALTAVPATFAVDTSFHRTTTTVAPGTCLTHLEDPRDGTKLVLVEATKGIGDFRVTPAGRYGLRPGELLRVDCATGAALGAVPGR